jgi:uncharacterized protein involved in outer membrane biogenesis
MRFLLGLAATLLATLVLAAVFIAVFGWNWLRAPLERMVLQKTGRELAIHGDLTVKFGWPQVRLRGATLTFANPAWTQESTWWRPPASRWRSMCPSCCSAISPSPKCACSRPRCSWRRPLTGARTGCWTRSSRTRTPASASGASRWTAPSWGMTMSPERPAFARRCRPARTGPGTARHPTSRFTAVGQYKGLAVKAQGSGGPVLALRDTTLPYPLKFEASAGRTQVKADGTLTGLLALDAIDMRMTLRGDNLEQLYPLLGIAFPATRPYLTEGHLLHAGSTWRYEQFTGRIGTSDIAGFVQVVTGGKRPALTAGLTSRVLALEDLGPVIGARPGSAARAAASPVGRARVLPDLPFKTDRWDSVDAEVDLSAKSLRHAKALPLENLVTHLSLRDAVLTLDPLNFGLAGGQLDTRVTLDGRSQPIQAHAQVRARKVLLSRLFPTVNLNRNSIGQVNGQFDLTGKGDSVGSLLASADGKLGLVVAGGEVSKLMMEKSGCTSGRS